MQIKVEKTIQRCDYVPCESDAVSTCKRCDRDWCLGHGAVVLLQIVRAKLPQAEPEADQKFLPVRERVEWEDEEKLEMELCDPCINALRQAVKSGKFEALAP